MGLDNEFLIWVVLYYCHLMMIEYIYKLVNLLMDDDSLKICIVFSYDLFKTFQYNFLLAIVYILN